MGVFCLAMLLFGGSMLKIVYGEKYADYGMVIAVLALVQLVSAVNAPLTSSLMAMERDGCRVQVLPHGGGRDVDHRVFGS